MVTIQLYQLRKIRLSCENVLNSLAVEMESIRCQLEAVFFCNTIL